MRVRACRTGSGPRSGRSRGGAAEQSDDPFPAVSPPGQPPARHDGQASRPPARPAEAAAVSAHSSTAGLPDHGAKDAIITRRGKEAKNIAKVAAARKLLTLVFYGMRDGQWSAPSFPDSPSIRMGDLER